MPIPNPSPLPRQPAHGKPRSHERRKDQQSVPLSLPFSRSLIPNPQPSKTPTSSSRSSPQTESPATRRTSPTPTARSSATAPSASSSRQGSSAAQRMAKTSLSRKSSRTNASRFVYQSHPHPRFSLPVSVMRRSLARNRRPPADSHSHASPAYRTVSSK